MRYMTIDQYLATLSDDKRAALEHLRRTIRTVVPTAEECISYQIPAFRLDGRMLVWFGASARHCSFYPGAAPIAALERELAAYDTSKGTLRFRPDKPLPVRLVKELLAVRLAENRSRTTASRASRASRRPPRT